MHINTIRNYKQNVNVVKEGRKERKKQNVRGINCTSMRKNTPKKWWSTVTTKCEAIKAKYTKWRGEKKLQYKQKISSVWVRCFLLFSKVALCFSAIKHAMHPTFIHIYTSPVSTLYLLCLYISLWRINFIAAIYDGVVKCYGVCNTDLHQN